MKTIGLHREFTKLLTINEKPAFTEFVGPSIKRICSKKKTYIPGMNLLIILFRLLTSSDPGTQSSSLSSLLSLELSLSRPADSVLRFLLFAGGFRVRIGSPAGTAGTGSPKTPVKKYKLKF